MQVFSCERRRITLLDALILIAATALGLAPIKAADAYLFDRPLPAVENLRNRDIIMRGQVLATSMLAAWTAAVVAIGLAAPRRSWRRAVRRPGFVACCAATVGVVGHLLVASLQFQGQPRGRPLFSEPTDVIPFVFPISYNGGMLVGGAWLALLLSRTWRAEPSWLDRLGRALGAAWIGVLLIAEVRVVL